MQPSPIAETRRPADPSCRVITGGPLLYTSSSRQNLPTDLNRRLWCQATTGRLLRMVDSGSAARLILINRCRVSTGQSRPTSRLEQEKLSTVRPFVCSATAWSIRSSLAGLLYCGSCGGPLAESHARLRLPERREPRLPGARPHRRRAAGGVRRGVRDRDVEEPASPQHRAV